MPQPGDLDLGQEERRRVETITSCFYAGIKCCDGRRCAAQLLQCSSPAAEWERIAGWEILRGFEPPLSQLLFAMSKLNDTLLQSMQITFATLYDVDPL